MAKSTPESIHDLRKYVFKQNPSSSNILVEYPIFFPGSLPFPSNQSLSSPWSFKWHLYCMDTWCRQTCVPAQVGVCGTCILLDAAWANPLNGQVRALCNRMAANESISLTASLWKPPQTPPSVSQTGKNIGVCDCRYGMQFKSRCFDHRRFRMKCFWHLVLASAKAGSPTAKCSSTAVRLQSFISRYRNWDQINWSRGRIEAGVDLCRLDLRSPLSADKEKVCRIPFELRGTSKSEERMQEGFDMGSQAWFESVACPLINSPLGKIARVGSRNTGGEAQRHTDRW